MKLIIGIILLLVLTNVVYVLTDVMHDDSGYASSVQQTIDGGYVIAGATNSYDTGYIDFWLVKTDSNGNKEWDKTFGGGDEDYAESVQQTTDGGYIIAGRTESFGAGQSDGWLVKTDSNGNKEWDKTFGGGDKDYAESVQQTTDGGYIIAGSTGLFGASQSDGWLVKTDSNGNKEWDKTFGGVEYDCAESVQQTTDGGYIIAGRTGSFGAGQSDGWLVKTDSNGNKEWDKTFGGTSSEEANSVQQTSDAGYIIAGSTGSFGAGHYDGWLVKTDSNGNKEWDTTFGGTSSEEANSVQQTLDAGYIIAGSTGFGAGQLDGWLVKTDSNGNKEWDKTFGGVENDWAESVQQTSDGGYIFAGMHSPTTWLVKTDSNGNKEWDKTFVGASILSEPTFLLIGGAAILLSLVLLTGKSRRKEQETQKRMEMQASSKLKRAKSRLNKSGQLGIDTSQLEDILAKAEQAFQKEDYTHTIDYVKNYFALINKAEKNKKQLEQMRKSASEQIKSAKFSIEKAERLGVTIKHAIELNTKAQSAFNANDYDSAINYTNKSRGTAEQLIDENKPSISIELPPKMEYKAWKQRELLITNRGTAHAVAITITFLTALEVRDFKIIARLDAGERKTINVNIKPTEKGEVPVDYSIEFKDLIDRVYKTEDTATIQISTGIETAWESATSPIEKVETDSNKLVVLRKDEFFNGFIRLKISVQNKMQLTATDVFLDIDYDDNVLRFDHHEPDTYDTKKEKIQLGNISSNSDRTITLYFDGLICSKGAEINCRIDYKDAYGKPDLVRMEPVKIPIVCPIFKTEQDINIGRLKELIVLLPAQSSKEFLLPSGVSINKALTLCREVIQMHDARHVRTFKTTDNRTYETWYYGKTKVEMIDLVIKASVSKETERIEIFVAAPDQEDIVGLLAELGRNISKRGESLGKLAPVFNVSIKDSQIIRSNLLGACDINGICDGNVVIENSWVRRSNIASNANNVSIHIKDNSIVQRSTIGAGTKKCPNCGIVVEGEQKFCLECGAKL